MNPVLHSRTKKLSIFWGLDVILLKPITPTSRRRKKKFNFQCEILTLGSNMSEGIVAKPMKNIVCKDKHDEEARVIVKLKSMHFQEIKDTIPPARKG